MEFLLAISLLFELAFFAWGLITIFVFLLQRFNEVIVKIENKSEEKDLARIALLISIFVGLICLVILVFFGLFSFASVDVGAAIRFIIALVLITLGFIVYSIRSRARIFYGLAECSVGAYITYQSAGTDNYIIDLQIILGLYVIVRGIDNLEKSLKFRKAWHDKWKEIFGSQV